MPQTVRRSVPVQPGIYRFRRSNGDLLYIGKAASLKTRVNSYFQASRRHSEHTLEMLTQAVKLDFTITESALEAALLESDEIKRFNPPYNKALRNDHRKLYYHSKDFKHHAGQKTELCPLGPVPAPEYFTALNAMGNGLVSGTHPGDTAGISRFLCIPERYIPEATCLRQGIDLFLNDHRDGFNSAAPWRSLLRIGYRSWREKFIFEDSTEVRNGMHEDDTTEQDDPEPFEWTPESVSRAMVSILRRCGYLLRRSRWLNLLCEAAIAWPSPHTPARQRRLLVLNEGRIIDRCDLALTAPVPAPPGGHPASRFEPSLPDLTVHDRLRVLTTELRRLSKEERPVTVRLGSRSILKTPQLNRLFQWL